MPLRKRFIFLRKQKRRQKRLQRRQEKTQLLMRMESIFRQLLKRRKRLDSYKICLLQENKLLIKKLLWSKRNWLGSQPRHHHHQLMMVMKKLLKK